MWEPGLLSPFNRGLFATASTKKRELNYEFVWVKNGTIFMRKDGRSRPNRIVTYEDLENLVGNLNEETEVS